MFIYRTKPIICGIVKNQFVFAFNRRGARKTSPYQIDWVRINSLKFNVSKNIKHYL